MTPADLEKPYEDNTIGLSGILWFGGGLFSLIVVTFFLMAFFLGQMREFAKENAGPANPLKMTEEERLPPEPRLQSAPGFGINTDKGRVNLELREPQAEYREFHKESVELIENGHKDPKTGAVTALPIDVAKERFLESGFKARSGSDAEKFAKEARMIISDSTSGRRATETRR